MIDSSKWTSTSPITKPFCEWGGKHVNHAAHRRHVVKRLGRLWSGYIHHCMSIYVTVKSLAGSIRVKCTYTYHSPNTSQSHMAPQKKMVSWMTSVHDNWARNFTWGTTPCHFCHHMIAQKHLLFISTNTEIGMCNHFLFFSSFLPANISITLPWLLNW